MCIGDREEHEVVPKNRNEEECDQAESKLYHRIVE